MNFLGPAIKLCRIKRKMKAGRKTFFDRIKRRDVSRQARRARRLRDPAALLLGRDNAAINTLRSADFITEANNDEEPENF